MRAAQNLSGRANARRPAHHPPPNMHTTALHVIGRARVVRQMPRIAAPLASPARLPAQRQARFVSAGRLTTAMCDRQSVVRRGGGGVGKAKG